MTHQEILQLTLGPSRWPLDQRPMVIGRLPENDVVIGDDSASRVHAYVVPTPDGPLLVDRSRHGTRVNGEDVRAPWLLSEGDEIRIGEAVIRVERGTRLTERESQQVRPPSGLRDRLRMWLARYGPSEVLGSVASVGTAVGLQQATGSVIVAAYAGAIAENIVFYGVMFLRESVRAAHQAGVRGRPFSHADLLPVARDLLLEFGAAEVLDSLAFRPLLLGLGLEIIGGALGGLIGKLAADVVFYGPVLAVYEWRLARTGAWRRRNRPRRTTGAGVVPPEV
jgi:pSer/pThr/pTyr-binding forkhead associated (FHA) protein